MAVPARANIAANAAAIHSAPLASRLKDRSLKPRPPDTFASFYGTTSHPRHRQCAQATATPGHVDNPADRVKFRRFEDTCNRSSIRVVGGQG